MKGKHNILVLLVAVIVFLCVPISRADQAGQNFGGNGQVPVQKHLKGEYVPGELLVKFKERTLRAKMQALHSTLQAQEIRQIVPLRVRRIKLPSDISVEEAITHYETDPNVEYAEPNYIIHFMKMPNDSDFQKLWGLHNTGQEVNGVTGTSDADIDAPEAWDITTGSSEVIIAVADTGVAHQHPDINDNIWVNSAELNGAGDVDDDANGYVDDIYGWDFWDNDATPNDYNTHGTHIAGIIAALGNNNEAITGVNWTAKIMALRIGGVVGTVGDAAAAIIYAADNHAHIINASWGGPDFSQTEYDAIDYANDHGVLLVAAAGNVGENNDVTPEYPASYDLPNIISVAATDQDDSLAEFSNYGINSVDVAAPGVNIYSTIPEFSYGTPVEIYNEDFELYPTEEWVQGGTSTDWQFVSGTGFENSVCLEDSPGEDSQVGYYSNNTESFAGYSTSFSSEKNNRYTLSFKLKAYLKDDVDFLALMGSADGDIWFAPDVYFINLGNYRTGTTSGFIDDTFDLTALADVLPSFYFGFGIFSNESVTDDGVYIDNLKLYREPINISSNYSYKYEKGTSMAAPHVSGLAALIWADDSNLTYTQVKNFILNGVDTKPNLEGKILTGGRINANNSILNAPSPPSNLFTTAISIIQIDLSWTDNSYGETGFKIERKTGTAGTYSQIAIVTADTESYSDIALIESTAYYYRVRAYNSSSNSSYSNETNATTPSASSGGGGGRNCFITTAGSE